MVLEMAVKTAERDSAAAQGGGDAGGAGNSFHGFLGALPHGDGIHGGGKNVAFGG